MERHPVSSSNLRSVGYDMTTQTIEIEFHSGGMYRYFGVPQGVYQGLMQAGSKGSHFADFIKDHYAWARA